MTTGAIQTYAVIQARVAIFADSEMRRVTDAATKYLPRGATVSGRPSGQNNMVRLSDYGGFVSADALAPCYRYCVSDTTRVLEVPQTDAFQAQGGTTFKHPGEQFDAAMVAPGWLWIISGVGYIPESAAQNTGVAQLTYRGGERAVNDFSSNMIHTSHNLSHCAATFCGGDLARYLDLYYLVVHAPSELPSNDTQVFPTWREWFANLFQSLRQAVQH